MTSRSMEKKSRFCTSLYILGTWDDVAGFKYEWKVKGECILTYYFKNYFLFNKFSVKPRLWHENWRFLENHPNVVKISFRYLNVINRRIAGAHVSLPRSGAMGLERFSYLRYYNALKQEISLLVWTLPKIPIISKNSSNKNCSELNVVEKSQWEHMSALPPVELEAILQIW